MRRRFLTGEWNLESPRIGSDAHKAEQYCVRKTYRFGPGETSFPPCRRFSMEWGLGIIAVEQQIDIANYHWRVRRFDLCRKASASSSSANWFKLAGSIPGRKLIAFGFTRKGARFVSFGLPLNPNRTAALRVSLKLRRDRCIESRSIRSTSLSKVTVVRIKASSG
jgi:hypothetical protein